MDNTETENKFVSIENKLKSGTALVEEDMLYLLLASLIEEELND